MNSITVKIVKLDAGVPTPVYKTIGSAGCDVHAAEDVDVHPYSRALVRTGLMMEIQEGFECQIRSRSSLALKHGIFVLNSPATIDSDYRGEVGVLLFNTTNKHYAVEKGERIAQLVFMPTVTAMFEVSDALNDTIRGDGGWGSTGTK